MITGKGIRYAFLYDYILKARKKITRNMCDFILQFRKDFIFMGNQ